MNWQDHAACRPHAAGVNPYVRVPNKTVAEAFFGPATDRTKELAKRVCDHCPVRSECLNEALDAGLDDGIWGGLDEDERRAMRRAQVGRSV